MLTEKLPKIAKILTYLFAHRDIIEKGVIYLRRYYITSRHRHPRLFLHLIRQRDDDRDPHDHPWSFWSLVLWGGYWEANYHRLGTEMRIKMTWRGPLSLKRHKATHIHQIVHVAPNTWTLVLAGKPTRVWGFWPSPNQFIPATQYLNIDEIPPEDRVSD